MKVLDKHDLTSATWLKLVAHYEARLQSLRAKNDAPKDESKTAMLRGRIMEVKELLGLSEESPEQEPDDLGY